MTTVSIRAMNARQFSDWVTRLNLRQITAGPSTYSSALMARGMPSRSGNGYIARFNRKGSLQLHAVSAWGLLSWGTGRYEVPSFSNVHSRSPLRRAQIPRLNHGRSVSLRPGMYVKGGFGSAKSAPPMPAVPPPFSGCREIPHALRRAQLAPPSSQPVVDFPAVRDRDRCERLPSQASGCRNPQLHLMPCIIPVIRVALRASRPMCRQGRHMLPMLMHPVHALANPLAGSPPGHTQLPQRDRHTIWVAQGRPGLPHTEGVTYARQNIGCG